MPSLSRSILDSALNVNDRNRDLSLARDVEEQAAPLRQALSFNVPDLGTLLGSNAPASVQQPAAPAPAQPSGPFGFAPVSFALPDIDTLIGRPKPQPAAIQQPAQMPQAEGTRVPATPSGSPAAMPTGAGAPTGAAPTTHFDGTPLSPEAADLARRAYAAAVKAGHPDPAEFVEQMALESMQWNPEVVAGRRASPSGAQGVAQLMPEVAAQAGVNPHDVDAALAYAAGRMARNYRTYGGDRERALAEYHMGAGNLERHGPRGLEDTAAYIDAITGRARGRGQPAPTTPPATPSGTPQPMPQASAASHYEGDGHDHGAAYDVAFGFNQEYGSAQFNQSIPRHRGVDLVVRGAKDGGRGSPVPAFRGGTVVAVTSDPNGGNGIILQDEQGLYHRYFHFDSINVKQGDRIAPGQHIGILGASGTEGFPHVHFEVSQGINGDPMDQLIDPRPYMRPAGRQGAAQPAAQPAPVAQQQAPLPMASGDETMMMRTGDDLPASQVSAGDQKRARLMAAQGQTADDEVQYRAPLDQPMDDPGGAPALAPASPATAAVNPDEYDPAWLQGPPAISPITGEPTGLAPLPGQAQTRPQADLSVTGEVQAGASYGPTAYDTPPATYAPPLTHQAADPARWEQAEESTPPWVREPYGPPMPAMPDTRRVEYPHLLPESRFPQLAGAAGVAPAPEVRIPRAEYAEAREAGVPIAYAPQGPVQGPPAPAPSAAERIAGGTYGREVAGKATGDGLTPFDILSLPDDARDALIDLVYDASPATVAAARAAGSRLTGQATGGFADMVESLVNPHKREGARAALGITLGLPLALGADRIRKAGGAAGRIVGELLDPGGKVAEAGLRAAGRGAKDAWRNSGAVAGIGAAGAAGAGMAMGEVDDPADVLEAGAAGAGTALAARYGTAPALRAAGRGARAAGEAWQQGRQVARELNAADRQGAPAYAALGAVPEGESRRFYHGTAGAFERPDPGKFDPNGLFGPGYYLTSDPRVASSYADAAQGPTKERLERLQRDRDELVPYIESYRSGPLRRAFGPADADRRLAEVIDEIRAIDREMAELVPSGPNVRAIDVPSGLRLLDPEAVMKPAEVRRIARRLAQATGSRYFADLSQTSNADMGYLSRSYSGMMTEWRNTEPGASWARGNQALAAAGYDGLQHTGGKRVPMMDDAGKPIEHDVTIIFPESLGRIRNALSGEVGGATFGTLPEAGTTGGAGRLGTVNRALGQGLASAASGSITGTFNAQANPDDPNAFATGFVAGAVGPAAVARGARAAARRAGAATDAGGAALRGVFGDAGATPPSRPTLEVLQQRLERVGREIDRLAPDDPLREELTDLYWRLESERIDAFNARRALEPAIRSDVGRRVESFNLTEESSDTLADAMRPRERVSPQDAADLGGPASVPVGMAGRANAVMPFDPASAAAGGLAGAASGEEGEEADPLRAGAGMVVAGMLGRKRLSKVEREALERAAKAADARPRPAGLGNVPPSAMREPTLPGMEAPYVRPNLPDISEEASGPRSLSDVLASPERQAGIPGLESPTPAARPVGAVADDLALTPEQRTARASEAVQQFPGAQSWVARAAERNRREIARRDQEPLSPVRWLMRLAGNVGYGSMLGPGTAAFNTFIGIGEPIWSMPKEAVRGVVRAARAGNLSALREQGEMQWGALYGMSRMGEAVIDVLRGRGAYAPNPNFPTLSEQTVNPVAKLVAQATEVPGRVWSGLPDAIFGTIAQHAGEARAAAQAATNKGLTGKAWSDEVGRLLEDARAVGRGELPTSPDVQQVVDAGAAYAKRQTYRDELGKVGKAAEGAAKLGNTPLLGNWASPFFTSIWNAGLRQAEKSPFGLGMNTAPTRIDKYYDAIVGGAVILALAQYARSGGVTGSGPADPRERELLQAEGWQPYSTLTPGPDGQWYYVPNRGYALFEGPLNAAGEIHDYFAYGKPDADARAKFDDAARRLGQVIRQNPYAASGIVSILDAYNHGPAAEVADNLARMTPLAATARTLGMAGDDKERTTDRGKGVPIEDEIFQRWQLATGQRSGLPAAQDAFGQERENRRPGGWAFAPSMTRKGDDPVARVFREARVLPGDPKSELRVSQSQAIPPVPLKPAERRLWDQKRGEVLRDAGQFIAAEPEWKDAPLEVKQRVLRQVMDAAGKTADGAVLASLGEEEVARRIEAALRKKAS